MNNLEGTVPAFGQKCCPNLKVLHLYGNPQLSGSLPSSLGELKYLEELRMWGCSLSGSLPPALGGCSSLKVLHLAKNQLTGSLPSELGQCAVLKVAYPHDNLFTGDVPASTFATGWKRIRKLTLGGNPKLSGITNVENALRQSRGPNKVDFSYAANDMVDTEGSLFNGGGVRRGSLQIVSAELKDDDEDS